MQGTVKQCSGTFLLLLAIGGLWLTGSCTQHSNLSSSASNDGKTTGLTRLRLELFEFAELPELPSSLEVLELPGLKVNPEVVIHGDILPPNLTALDLAWSNARGVTNLPPSLEYLAVGGTAFESSLLGDLRRLQSLKTLVLRGEVRTAREAIIPYLPPSLENLVVPDEAPSFVPAALPNGLLCLSLPNARRLPASWLMPRTLERMEVHSLAAVKDIPGFVSYLGLNSDEHEDVQPYDEAYLLFLSVPSPNMSSFIRGGSGAACELIGLRIASATAKDIKALTYFNERRCQLKSIEIGFLELGGDSVESIFSDAFELELLSLGFVSIRNLQWLPDDVKAFKLESGEVDDLSVKLSSGLQALELRNSRLQRLHTLPSGLKYLSLEGSSWADGTLAAVKGAQGLRYLNLSRCSLDDGLALPDTLLSLDISFTGLSLPATHLPSDLEELTIDKRQWSEIAGDWSGLSSRLKSLVVRAEGDLRHEGCGLAGHIDADWPLLSRSMQVTHDD